ncbi:MAG: FG-GAP repeat protein [Chloroflexi bacterium]|nr:FG-GAP repeat protein [Chloroflexota bacterium]
MRLKFLLALFALAALGFALLLGPAGFGPEPQSAEAALLSEVKKLLASDAQAQDSFGLSVAVSGDTAVVGAWGEDAGGGDAGAAYIYKHNSGGADNWGQVKKLTASDAQADDNFGISVAVSGDIAVVGAQGEDAGGSNAGAAYVFQRDQGGANNWGELTKLTASDAQAFDFFGTSVAASGDIVVVGARFEDAGGSGAGAAYVFQRDQGGTGNWGQVKKLTASDAQAGDFFGSSVAVSGDTAVVGAWFEDAGGSDAGAAYVFQRDQGGANNWGEVKKLLASDAQDFDQFGYSVAVSGDTAVIGARWEDAGGAYAGAAYVFQRDGGGTNNWGEVKKLTASDAQTGDQFGTSVAVSGDTAVVGADLEDVGNPQSNFNAGAVYTLQRDQGGADNWGQVTKLTASDAQFFDFFGGSVAVSGDTVIVGAAGEDAGGDRAGAAYVFQEPPPPTATSTPMPTPTPTPTFTPKPTKQPDPGDTDGDGCSDMRENGLDETLGGLRDYLNPWDFYDVAGLSGATPDGVIDLLNDILGVIAHFSPQGAPPYDVHYDRGPSAGPNAWNMTAPDGSIDLLNDILGVILQFGHDCT